MCWVPRDAVGGVVVNPAEQQLQIFGLDVEPHALQEVTELRLAEEPSPFWVVFVEDGLSQDKL